MSSDLTEDDSEITFDGANEPNAPVYTKKLATCERLVQEAREKLRELHNNNKAVKRDYVDCSVTLAYAAAVLRKLPSWADRRYFATRLSHPSLKLVLQLVKDSVRELLTTIADQSPLGGARARAPQHNFSELQHVNAILHRRVAALSEHLRGAPSMNKDMIAECKDKQACQCWLFGGGDREYMVPWSKVWKVLMSWHNIDAQLEEVYSAMLDYERTEYVGMHKFMQMVRLFGPFDTGFAARVNAVVRGAGFQGFLSPADAARLLHGQPRGTYIIYFDRYTPSSLAVTVALGLQSATRTYKVRLKGDEEATIEECAGTGDADIDDESGSTALSPAATKQLADDVAGRSGSGRRRSSASAATQTLAVHRGATLAEAIGKDELLQRPFPPMPWTLRCFYGSVAMSDVARLLAKSRAGTYLLRFSSSPGAFALSLKGSDDKIFHNRVRTTATGWRFETQTSSESFASLDELVRETSFLVRACRCNNHLMQIRQSGTEFPYQSLVTQQKTAPVLGTQRLNPYLDFGYLDVSSFPSDSNGSMYSSTSSATLPSKSEMEGWKSDASSVAATDPAAAALAEAQARAAAEAAEEEAALKESQGVERPSLTDLPLGVRERLRRLEESLARSQRDKEELGAKLHEIESLHDAEHRARVGLESKMKVQQTLESGQLFKSSEVKWHEMLGSGGSGAKVHRATVNGLTFAIKHLDAVTSAVEAREAMLREIQLLELLCHENLVNYLGHDLRGTELCLYMEFYPGTLMDVIVKRAEEKRKFSRAQIVDMSLQIVSGLAYLHGHSDSDTKKRQPIVHCDVKSNNVFVTMTMDNEVYECKLGDFDVSLVMESKKKKASNDDFVGTLGWAAPEVLRREPYNDLSDMWSFGIVLYELMELRVPYDYERAENADIWQLAADGVGPRLTEGADHESEYREVFTLYSQCVQKRPSARPKSKNARSTLFKLHEADTKMPKSRSFRAELSAGFMRKFTRSKSGREFMESVGR